MCRWKSPSAESAPEVVYHKRKFIFNLFDTLSVIFVFVYSEAYLWLEVWGKPPQPISCVASSGNNVFLQQMICKMIPQTIFGGSRRRGKVDSDGTLTRGQFCLYYHVEWREAKVRVTAIKLDPKSTSTSSDEPRPDIVHEPYHFDSTLESCLSGRYF